ncbi:MAG: MFS transporter [Deltaproteobacteria bacterium]|nr:MFS transporter [Deltaproteobacteria bacterium]MBW2070466.1 MFS transporter [Deltaproteobacteria bacterium]
MQPQSLRSHLSAILLLAAIFFLNFLARITLAPLLPTIEQDLHIGHTMAGSLFFFISVGYFLSLLASGFVASRLTHRTTIIISATAVGAALLAVSRSSNLLEVRLGLFLLGLAAGLYLPSGISTLTSLVSPEKWGKALAIHEIAPNLAAVAAPLIAEVLLHWFFWRTVLALLGGASLVVGLIYFCFGRGGQFLGRAPQMAFVKSLLARPAFWITTLLFGLAIGASLGVYAMLPLYLVTERGFDRSWANTLVGLSRISGLLMAFVAGWATDRFGAKRTISGVFLLTAVSTVLLGAVPSRGIVIIVFIQPLLAVSFFPAGLAALSCLEPPSSRNVAISLTIPFAFVLGAGAIPTGIGIMADRGSFAGGFIVVGLLILSGFVLSLSLKLPAPHECPASSPR